jgi:hypothetical protein
MSRANETDLDLLADGIEKLLGDLSRVVSGEDKTEIEDVLELAALLEIAHEAYTMIQARLKKATRASRRRSNRPAHHLPRY